VAPPGITHDERHGALDAELAGALDTLITAGAILAGQDVRVMVF
jgi:hypothetical protein